MWKPVYLYGWIATNQDPVELEHSTIQETNHRQITDSKLLIQHAKDTKLDLTPGSQEHMVVDCMHNVLAQRYRDVPMFVSRLAELRNRDGSNVGSTARLLELELMSAGRVRNYPWARSLKPDAKVSLAGGFAARPFLRRLRPTRSSANRHSLLPSVPKIQFSIVVLQTRCGARKVNHQYPSGPQYGYRPRSSYRAVRQDWIERQRWHDPSYKPDPG